MPRNRPKSAAFVVSTVRDEGGGGTTVRFPDADGWPNFISNFQQILSIKIKFLFLTIFLLNSVPNFLLKFSIYFVKIRHFRRFTPFFG